MDNLYTFENNISTNVERMLLLHIKKRRRRGY